MPSTPSLRRLVSTFSSALSSILLTALPMAAAPALAGPATPSGAVPVFHLAGQTSTGDTVWAERCGPDSAAPATPALRATRVAWTPPQPDRGAVAALMSALRHGDFETTGVRVVETDDGPMLRLAGARPGVPDTYFMLCNVALHTTYD